MTDDVLWSIDGVALQSDGWTIDDFTGLEAPPQYRGGPVTVPARDGQVWRPLVADGRTLAFRMSVFGTNTDGYELGPDVQLLTPQAQLWSNWRTLRSLFFGSGSRQLSITKAWDDITATGSGVFAGGLEPENLGLQAFRFAADVFMADPWLYAPEVNLGSWTVGTHDVTGLIAGDVTSPRWILTLTGPLTNPSVTISAGNDVLSSITYTGEIAEGDSLNVVMPGLDFIETGDVSGSNITTEQTLWVALDPSATSVTIGGSGAGAVDIDYEAAYV